jgi:multidrug resistance efflux pump
VIAISPAPGWNFAMAPSEYAIGYLTKIVQRVTVKISLDDQGRLPGMSEIVSVDTVLSNGSRP